MTTTQKQCAHCDSGTGPESLDYDRRVKCPACGLPICPSCRKASSPTDCRSFCDPVEATDR